MSAVAVTDHGNLYGACEFFQKAKAKGIKPILGIEAYVAPGSRTDRTPGGKNQGGFHLVLLAENLQGWKNLVLKAEHLTEFAYRPKKSRRTYRMIALRKKIDEKEGQQVLFEKHRYFFYVTNDPDMTPEQVVRESNQRCDQENVIEQLQSGDSARGREIFDAAGCIKCHVILNHYKPWKGSKRRRIIPL